jgi:hypothetical protein
MTGRGRRRTGRGRSIAGRAQKPSSPTRSEVETASRAKYKDFIMKDIASSERRRGALETMWQAEKDAEMTARKQAVEEYKLYMEGAPDPELDTDGVLRAAFMNTPLGRSVSGNLAAHIQASMDKRDQQDPNSPENRSVSQGEYEKAATVGEKFTGYGRKISDGAGVIPEPAKFKTKQEEIAVKLPNGSKGTVVSKEGDRVEVMDRATRETRWYKIDEVEMIERRGLDPLMGLT